MTPDDVAEREAADLALAETVAALLSPNMCRVLLAVADLKRPRWWEAVQRAQEIYGSGRTASFATLRALLRRRLVREIELRHDGSGDYYGRLFELTPCGERAAPIARRRHQAGL